VAPAERASLSRRGRVCLARAGPGRVWSRLDQGTALRLNSTRTRQGWNPRGLDDGLGIWTAISRLTKFWVTTGRETPMFTADPVVG
jgi:hypothetical protein